MVLLAVTTDTWIVTGLGFGIVLALLFCLVFILQFFGWTMQKLSEPRKPKSDGSETAQKAVTEQPKVEEKAAVETAQPPVTPSADDEIAAVAYALYLAHHSTHDIATAMISLNKRETAWNTKSIGLNNVGF